MILIITHKKDYTADYLISKLNDRGINYFRFNCEEYLNYHISISYDTEVTVSINGVSDFRSVWFRRTQLPDISANNETERIYILNEIRVFLDDLFDIIPARWLSSPRSVRRAENKLFQLREALFLGFSIPNTCLTTDKFFLKDFFHQHANVIIKPLGRGRLDYPCGNAKLLFTNRVPSGFINRVDDLCLTPAIFQEEIDRDYELRITIVGREIFAAKIDLNDQKVVDWRRDQQQFSVVEIPNQLKVRCLKLMKILDIQFGAFDFIKTKKGEYVFLEVNPNGQWVWIEKQTGLEISEAIIKELVC